MGPLGARDSSFSSATLLAVQGPDEYRPVREGRAQVLTQIQGGGAAVLAGCQVLEGQVSEGSFVRISRNRRALWTGRIRQLRLVGGGSRAAVGQECVIAFDGFNDVKPGDLVEAFQLELA
jgi:translation initiation factor IF-2